jgi:alpha-beta hydrolase superfamily lysophospholipase
MCLPAARIWLAAALTLLLVAACTGLTHQPRPGHTTPSLELATSSPAFVTGDELRLPLRRYLPVDAPPCAIVLALHGFNDYSKAFDRPARWLAARGIALYAYDQRGFGAGPSSGLWAGTTRLADDAVTVALLLRRAHPDLPLYLLGESMGGAVALVAAATHRLQVDGLILVAPAVWARSTQPWYQRAALRTAAGLWPSGKISARFLGRQVSDNPATLAELENDPLVIRRVRYDTLRGLVDLMDEALAAAPAMDQPLLLLYGGHDEIIPREPIDLFWSRLPLSERRRRIDYPQGWHLLLRDLDAERVYQDILTFLVQGPSRHNLTRRYGSGATTSRHRDRSKTCAKAPAVEFVRAE